MQNELAEKLKCIQEKLIENFQTLISEKGLDFRMDFLKMTPLDEPTRKDLDNGLFNLSFSIKIKVQIFLKENVGKGPNKTTNIFETVIEPVFKHQYAFDPKLEKKDWRKESENFLAKVGNKKDKFVEREIMKEIMKEIIRRDFNIYKSIFSISLH